MNSNARIFRPTFFHTLWAVSLGVALGLLLALPMLCLVGINVRAMLLIAFTPIYMLVACWFAIWYSKLTITPEGIRGYNALGVFRTVTWEEMQYATPINILGLRYVRVFTSRQWVLWMPLFHLQQQELHALILACAPPTHPLRQYIATLAKPQTTPGAL